MNHYTISLRRWLCLLFCWWKYSSMGRWTDSPKASQWHSWDKAWMGPQKSLASTSVLFLLLILPHRTSQVWLLCRTMQSMQLFIWQCLLRRDAECCDTSLSSFRTFVQSVYRQDVDLLAGGRCCEVYLGSRRNKFIREKSTKGCWIRSNYLCLKSLSSKW